MADDLWLDGGWGFRVQTTSSLQMSNSIVSNTEYAISYDSSVPASSVSFTTFYNSVWNCATGNVVWTSSNNIYLNEKSGAPADTVTGTQCSHNYDLIKPQTTVPAGANNIRNQDPRFVNGANGDFHLVMGSPAIDAADPGAAEAADYEGTPRPQGAARDIGAFEYKP